MDYGNQIEDALIASSGIKREAARSLGWAWSTFKDRIAKHPELTEKYCSNLIHDPVSHEAEILNKSDASVWGLSTYYDYTDDETGERKRGWIKTKRNAKPEVDNVQTIIEAMRSELLRFEPFEAMPLQADYDLCHMITITDLHVGMYAWHEETGNDWDLSLAYETATKSVEYLARQRNCEMGILNLQGDFYHHDGTGLTPNHGHVLDCDGRWNKVLWTGVNIVRQSVQSMLQHCKNVTISIVRGNHDEKSTDSLAVALMIAYENEPRVTVLGDPKRYKMFVWGCQFIGFAHGDKVKAKNLHTKFLSEFGSDYGAAEFRDLNSGHFHCEYIKEYSTHKERQHATIAGADNYAAEGDWKSKRQIRSVLFHKEYGEIANYIVTPKMIGMV